jgi:hypothetical protein
MAKKGFHSTVRRLEAHKKQKAVQIGQLDT